MTIDTNAYATFLEKVAEDIDIPPGKYQQAVDRYEAVGRWLEEGDYPGSAGAPDIYPQGLFSAGDRCEADKGRRRGGLRHRSRVRVGDRQGLDGSEHGEAVGR